IPASNSYEFPCEVIRPRKAERPLENGAIVPAFRGCAALGSSRLSATPPFGPCLSMLAPGTWLFGPTRRTRSPRRTVVGLHVALDRRPIGSSGKQENSVVGSRDLNLIRDICCLVQHEPGRQGGQNGDRYGSRDSGAREIVERELLRRGGLLQ